MPRGSHQLKIDLTDEQHQELSAAAKLAGHTMAAEVRLRLSQYAPLNTIAALVKENQESLVKLLHQTDAAYATYPAHTPRAQLVSIAHLSNRRKKA